MSQIRFDENLAIREVLDDIVGMVARREKLIDSADKQARESKDERIAQHVKKLKELMSDFLTLFSPILEKVRSYGDELKESISESEAYLKSLAGIIAAGKAIDGSSATIRELEKDSDRVQGELEQSTDILDKIQDLFAATKEYAINVKVAGSGSEDRPSSLSSTRTRRVVAEDDTLSSSRGRIVGGSRLSSH